MSTSSRRPFLEVAVVGLAVFVLAAAWFPARTAPAPEGWKLPRKKLEELKKQLPGILEDRKLWELLRNEPKRKNPEVRLTRQVGPEEAKVRFLFGSHYVVIYLRFYDGRWTTTRFEGSWPNDAHHHFLNVIAHRLMELIDQATEK
jgi:hypothetical protein